MVREQPEQSLEVRLANRAEEAIRDSEALWRELQAAQARIAELEAQLTAVCADEKQ